MSHKRIPKRKAAIAVGGVAALGAAAFLLPNANASQTDSDDSTPRTFKAADVPGLSAQLRARLGDTFAGSYYDAAGRRIVVNVVGDDESAMNAVKEAGAVPHQVRNSTGALETAARTLRTDAAIPGTAWSVDPRTNEIRVTADSTVTGAGWDRLESTVEGLGSGMATLKKSEGTFKTFVSGGDAIFGGNARCSLGFNVTAGDGSPAFLTAGHCGVAVDQWADDENGQPIATVDQATFPGEGDFSLVKYDDPATQAPSEVNVGGGKVVTIGKAAEAAVGQQVLRMGSTTGLHDGTVLGLDATVNYPEGTVTGLIQTDVCAEPGDSGGSLFSEDGSAIGLTSGGSGDCDAGGETFFQPVTTALQATGATLGEGGGQATGGGQADDQGGGQAGDQGAGQAGGQAGDQAGDQAGGQAGDQTGGDAQAGGSGLESSRHGQRRGH
ncbi:MULTISPECIES: S1 family peptidase [Streptomyces]|uniref:S1 family peptidase n=1 Tax=Streptomyces TaxID=1883 RepID=UPI0029B7A22E|nr:S1 family peptidase [Streptomyces sp. ME02-6978.2a]MDX3361223.1 S1 family peptidase [Streptomyces sp. ME02-6978.2a]